MRVRIIGSAAGGGFPQWNCNCPVCQAGRDGRATPRTQSSIVVRSGDDPWFLINASPDLRQQLADLPREDDGELRWNPVAGVLVTDGEIDHTAGLLLMRESSAPLRIYSSEAVRAALSDRYPVLTMLGNYSGVDWTRLADGEPTPLAGSTLEVEAFPTGGDAPLYMGGAEGPASIGLTIRDTADGRTLCYVPAIPELDDEIAARMSTADCVLADGTFWRADDLTALNGGTRDSWAMGHAPLTGDGGTLETLGGLDARTVLVHINNTNPILVDDSAERAAVEAAGVVVSFDGMEVEV
jgi:pyrroloquinoline quinone biosynthesis protein B